ncbi:MAG: LysM peptidoglycan-binding domain-containing protein [Waddliaceae bacterium]
MSRRDTILIAVLINCALLVVLFMMAIHTDQDSPIVLAEEPGNEIAASAPAADREAPAPPQTPLPPITANTRDELDQVLQNYASSAASSLQVPQESQGDFVEVTVKYGDYLEKIARANGTTVKAIMEANRLPSIRIDVGQILRVPVGRRTSCSDSENEVAASQQPLSNQEPKYYTLKSGDNPWKVAKQFHVRFNELLSLNDLDEERARNLQPGDILRVQ